MRPGVLAAHFGDALGDGAGGAQVHVGVADAAGQDRLVVAHVLVLGVGDGAGALAGTPVARDDGARGLDGAAQGRVDLLHRFAGRRRYLFAPLAERGRGGPPGCGELLLRVARVVLHWRLFSSRDDDDQRGWLIAGACSDPASGATLVTTLCSTGSAGGATCEYWGPGPESAGWRGPGRCSRAGTRWPSTSGPADFGPAARR